METSRDGRPEWSLTELHEIMEALAASRPIFHSEADFQHSLAWRIQVAHPDARVRLETRPEAGVHLDLLFSLFSCPGLGHRPRRKVAIEVKYFVHDLSASWEGEDFELRSQSGHEPRRYDFVKDVVRLEQLVPDTADVGYAIALTNDPGYWQRPTRTDPSGVALFEGVELRGSVGLDSFSAAARSRRRAERLRLRGTYVTEWRDFSEVTFGEGWRKFRYLALEVR